ncbi:hypothetical protein EYC59_00160 [Candidatus Saccharibacteria bacterium]|nr:MAG: hypothetical protein EYC59_00160 [Candidatus Saccharibacteria bacterium]
MLDPGYNGDLSNLMFMFALVAAVLMKVYYAAWTVQEIDPMYKGEMTQQKRYVMLVLTQGALLVIAVWMLSYGLTTVWANMNIWTNGTGPVGYVIWAMMALTLLSPVLTLVTAIHIYRRPSKLAKWVRRGVYYLTDDVRAGKPQTVKVVKTIHGPRDIIKNYEHVE